MHLIDNLEKLLASGQDSATLRFGLGNAYLQQDRPQHAAAHLEKAVEHDPAYSAAWKLLGKALAEADDRAGAIRAYERGIAAAEARGDMQAVKEMGVFLRRLQRSS